MYKISTLNKVFFSIILLLTCYQLNAQKTEKYLDYTWKECKPNVARFYSQIMKTDSGYCRKDYFIRERKLLMIGYYTDSLLQIKNGTFHYFHANGYPKSFGKYVNGKREGVWLAYHENKVKSDSTVYLHDEQIGESLSWHPNGGLCDSIYTNKDGSGISVSWYDNGFLSAIGRYTEQKKQHGLWKYYHRNGEVSSLETYYDSNLTNRKYFDENGVRLSDETNNDRDATFPGGKKEWFKYIEKKIFFPDDYRITNGDAATIDISYTVNEKGIIENVYAITAFDKSFDLIAVNTIRKSPQWLPAIEHNRKVKKTFIYTVNFRQYEW